MDEKRTGWDDLHLFLAVAREGGLSPAARTTGRSPATLGRELFIRNERGYELTTDARQLVEELTQIESRIARLTAPPGDAERPLVKISAGTWTTLALVEKLDDIVGSPADIRLRFVSSEARLDIARREVVIGIRNARPSGDSLAGRSLSRVEFAPYARRGAPDRWIKVLADTPSARWLHKVVGNDAVCEVNSPRNSLDLALAGKGVALLPTFIGDRQPELARTGDTVAELAHDRWIVTHDDDRRLPEVRRTIDRLCRVLDKRFG